VTGGGVAPYANWVGGHEGKGKGMHPQKSSGPARRHRRLEGGGREGETFNLSARDSGGEGISLEKIKGGEK